MFWYCTIVQQINNISTINDETFNLSWQIVLDYTSVLPNSYRYNMGAITKTWKWLKRCMPVSSNPNRYGIPFILPQAARKRGPPLADNSYPSEKFDVTRRQLRIRILDTIRYTYCKRDLCVADNFYLSGGSEQRDVSHALAHTILACAKCGLSVADFSVPVGGTETRRQCTWIVEKCRDAQKSPTQELYSGTKVTT